MNNLVSVILPVYNCEKYIYDSIKSILNSSYVNFELIIINDGSTDSSEKIIKSFNDNRINYLKNKTNIGLVKSLNIAINSVSGDFIARQDADDISIIDRLEKQVEFLTVNPDVGLTGSLYDKINEKSEIIVTKQLPLSDNEIKAALLKNNCFCHGSVMFRSEIIKKTGLYRETAGPTEDYDLWLRFSEITKLANIDISLYQWRVTADSIMSDSDSIQANESRVFLRELAESRIKEGIDPLESGDTGFLEKFNQLQSKLQKKPVLSKNYKLARMYFGFAEDLYRADCLSKCLNYLRLSIFANPFSVNAWKLLAGVLRKRLSDD